MNANYETIRELIQRVRARWRTLSLFHATVRGALAAAAVLGAALLVARWADRAPIALAAIGVVACALAIGAIVRAVVPLRHVPSDLRVARFIEERAPSLDDRLVTAVDVVTSGRHTASPAIADPMLADAAARARTLELDTIVPSETLRRAGFQAVAAAAVLAAVMFGGRGPARQAYDAAALVLFPEHVRLNVVPGNARLKAGTGLAIEASLAGNRAPVAPQVQMQSGGDAAWREAAMLKSDAGRFRLSFDSVTAPFNYRVIAGPITSPTFTVSVAH